MKAYLIALICMSAIVGQGAAASRSSSLAWRDFKHQHGKVYGAEEDAIRFANFLANKQLVERHNANSSASYKMGLNFMSDWSEEEFKRIRGPSQTVERKMDKSKLVEARFLAKFRKPGPLPEEVDWRKVPNRVSGVKEQKDCIAGWSFATTGLLEGQQALLNFSKIIPLSEQQLLDCSLANLGCQGGDVAYALGDIKQIGGIDSDQDYKYEGAAGQCRLDPSKFVMTPKHIYALEAGDELLLKKYVANYGPVATFIDASANLKNYHSGVLDDPDCDPDGLNHAVLVVGYGQDEKGLHYWIVKNSWGANWGDGGYFKIRRGVIMCGISIYPVVAEVV